MRRQFTVRFAGRDEYGEGHFVRGAALVEARLTDGGDDRLRNTGIHIGGEVIVHSYHPQGRPEKYALSTSPIATMTGPVSVGPPVYHGHAGTWNNEVHWVYGLGRVVSMRALRNGDVAVTVRLI